MAYFAARSIREVAKTLITFFPFIRGLFVSPFSENENDACIIPATTILSHRLTTAVR